MTETSFSNLEAGPNSKSCLSWRRTQLIVNTHFAANLLPLILATVRSSYHVTKIRAIVQLLTLVIVYRSRNTFASTLTLNIGYFFLILQRQEIGSVLRLHELLPCSKAFFVLIAWVLLGRQHEMEKLFLCLFKTRFWSVFFLLLLVPHAECYGITNRMRGNALGYFWLTGRDRKWVG